MIKASVSVRRLRTEPISNLPPTCKCLNSELFLFPGLISNHFATQTRINIFLCQSRISLSWAPGISHCHSQGTWGISSDSQKINSLRYDESAAFGTPLNLFFVGNGNVEKHFNFDRSVRGVCYWKQNVFVAV